ncbi:conserved hypothetical protein [Mesorhizobium plurifarium]|uniref:Cupin domain-containing protein n=1 Tax=Mesorhizobium plurifarium TaxID=69974 RepID=A0A090FXT4_MESPL|nr:conserved hypothetical protein [Mesorhizobium plurifarium]
MKVAKDDVDLRLQLPGAVIRQRLGFGSVAGYDQISAEHFSLSKGVDTTPLFKGLDGDCCQCPHWGYVLEGEITTTNSQGRQETVRKDDLFYWPPGHNVRVEEDAAIIMFSPQHEHSHVIDHMVKKTQR